MQEDPVDTWEMSRNDCVQQVQGNRNVFIDYPEFAWLLFGRELPADYDTPSGYAHEHGSDVENFTLTAASSDETRGTVTVRSHTVTAFPAEGYCVGGYTLTPADAAVVKQNGNVFTVSRMTKDCTLTVQFDPRTPSTVHFSVPEGVTAPADAAGYTGDTFLFPQPSGTPSDTAHDYTFLGWAAAPQTDTDSRPDFSAAGAEQMFTQAASGFASGTGEKVSVGKSSGSSYSPNKSFGFTKPPVKSGAVFNVGDCVQHKVFGKGMVMKAEKMGNDTMLEIAFDKAGTKLLWRTIAVI